MTNEKIKITLEECDQSTPQSVERLDGAGTSGVSGRKPFFLPFCILCAVVLIAVSVAVFFWVKRDDTPEPPPSLTVEAFQETFVSELNEKLSDPACPLRTFVEDAHVAVTVTSARVVQCRLTTIDGSNRIGTNQSNLASAELVIRFIWDGPIQKGGHTDVREHFDFQNNMLLETKIENTTALINVESPEFWEAIGVLLMGCL